MLQVQGVVSAVREVSSVRRRRQTCGILCNTEALLPPVRAHPFARTNTHTHTHERMHTHTHAHTHAHTHTYTQSCARTAF